MNWRQKAATQALLSHLPYGHHLNYLLGRYVTGHVLATEATFQRDLALAKCYVAAFQRHGDFAMDAAIFYEFGAGWDLIVALSLYTLGVNRQRLIDVRRLLRPDLVKRSANRLNDIVEASGDLRFIPKLGNARTWRRLSQDLTQHCGIEYTAPRDARATGWPDGSINYITASKVLSFIPEASLDVILLECHRILHPQGLIAFLIDYRDNYSYSDPAISPYNFLQYSDECWKRVNPPLHYQNRLRHSDYRQLFESAGFEIFEEQRVLPEPETTRALDSMRIDSRFAGYDRADLAAVKGQFLLRKTRSPRHYSLTRIRAVVAQSPTFAGMGGR